MRLINGLFWVLVVLLGASFAALNSRSVEIHYYFGVINFYLPLLLLIELALGVLLGILVVLPNALRSGAALRRARTQLKRLEDEVHELKSSAVETSARRFL